MRPGERDRRRGRQSSQPRYWDRDIGEPGPRTLDLRGLGARDFSSAEWAHPEIEFAVIADGPTSAARRGRQGTAQTFREFLGTWENYRVEVEEYRELDDERVLVLLHATGRGKTSGLDLRQMRTHGATLFQLHAGTVTRLVIYPYRERALADLGLPPDAGAPAS